MIVLIECGVFEAQRIPPPPRRRTLSKMKARVWNSLLLAFSLVCFATPQLRAQDWVHTGTNLGQDRIRIAAADFKPVAEIPKPPP